MHGALGESVKGACADTINATDPDEAITWIYTDMDRLIIQVIVPSVSAVGLLANLAFLIVIARVPTMRTVVSIYLANLALCDMLFLAFANFWYALTFWKTDVTLGWPVESAFGCAVLTLTSHTWYYASVGLMTFIGIERYLAICHPIRHITFKGGKRNAKLLAFIWISAVILTLTIIPRYTRFFYICMIWPDVPEYDKRLSNIGFCGSLSSYFNLYEGLLLIVVFVTSALGNGILYFKILKAMSSREIAKSTSSTSSQANRARDQVARTLIINGVVFFVCQIPSRIDNLEDSFDYLHVSFDILTERQEATITLVGHAFLFLNSVINPFIYVGTCRHYRQSMIEAFSCKRRKKVARNSTSLSLTNTTSIL